MLETLERHILEYLEQHPSAKDTVEGICTWWLPPGVYVGADEVEGALRALVAQGRLVACGDEPSRVYGLKPNQPPATLREIP
jgi:hypothetical protein